MFFSLGNNYMKLYTANMSQLASYQCGVAKSGPFTIRTFKMNRNITKYCSMSKNLFYIENDPEMGNFSNTAS